MRRVNPASTQPSATGRHQASLTLDWAVYGDPDRGRATGWALVFHALTGNQWLHTWWPDQLHALGASGRPVLCATIDHGCTHDPSPSPVRIAGAHASLVRALAVERLALVTGASVGGMVALEWLRISPVPIDRAVIIAAPARSGADVLAWNAAQRMAIEAGGAAGLAAARAIAMITYRSAREFEERFGRRQSRTPGQHDVEGWLRHHGATLSARFSPAAYDRMTRIMDAHDLGDLGAAAAESAERCRQITGVGIDTDRLIQASQVCAWTAAYRRATGVGAYREIRSLHGHDAFLIERDQVARLLGSGD